MCISTGNSDSIFFLGGMLLFELRTLKILLKTVCQRHRKPLNRILWNCVLMMDIVYIYTFSHKMLIWSFQGAIYILFELCQIYFVQLRWNWFSVWLEIDIRCIQHSQAMLERGVCELAHSFFHSACFFCYMVNVSQWIEFTLCFPYRKFMYGKIKTISK